MALTNNYTDYKSGLLRINLETLESRRQTICLKWAKTGLKNNTSKDLLPTNEGKQIINRKNEKHKVTFSNTSRMQN